MKRLILGLLLVSLTCLGVNFVNAQKTKSNYKLCFVSYEYKDEIINTLRYYDFNKQRTVDVYASKDIIKCPDWSLDGKRIAFALLKNNKSDLRKKGIDFFKTPFRSDRCCIYYVDPNGKHIRKVIDIKTWLICPAWTNDGKKLAFAGDVKYFDTIFSVNSDGTELRQLTDGKSTDYFPDWSPDNQQIVFSSDRDKKRNLYTMRSDGSKQTRLIDDGAENDYPNWSPDGKKIVFASNRTGKWEIYSLDLSSKQTKRLTYLNGYSLYPSWSPDGKKIAFASNKQENMPCDTEIYVMNNDGSHLQRITHNNYEDAFTSWSR